MTALAPIAVEPTSLPSLVRRAAEQLAKAETSAEVLEARETASLVYDAAKRAGRLQRAKAAHDEIIGVVYRAQADALEIESAAKRRLADEYDAAQERGEVGQSGARTDLVTSGNEVTPSAADAGLSRKDIHDARQFRNAEQAEPGITRRTLDRLVDTRQEPTKAALRAAVVEAARQGKAPERADRRNTEYVDDPAYRMLLRVLGPARSIMEQVDGGSIEIATMLRGFLDVGQRDRALRDIARARDFLSEFLEATNAH